jgi:hypothetical protein
MKYLFLVLFSAAIACAPSVKENETPEETKINPNWKSFDQPGYSIQYPPAWELNQNAQMGMSFIILSPLESDSDKFRENVNLIEQDISGKEIDLTKFTQISEDQIKTMITSSNMLESNRIKTSNGEYQKLIYTGRQGMYDLKVEQHYWITKTKAYVLTLTCIEDKFSAYKENGENIMNSFTIK